jgi:hypothetical protein
MYPAAITVDVGLTDIALGRMGHCMECPIARALHNRGYRNFTVTERKLEFENGVVYHTPPSAARFIKLFDAGYVPRSRLFTFIRIQIPAAVLAAEVVLA